MDSPYLQSLVGMREGLAGLFALLRGELGKARWHELVGRAVRTTVLLGKALEGAAGLE